MKELRKKTNLTILFLLSAILIAALVMVNVQSYGREREDIKRSLDILENRRGFPGEGPGFGEGPGRGEGFDPGEDPGLKEGKVFDPGEKPGPKEGEKQDFDRPERPDFDEDKEPGMKPRDLKNMMVMDHELYTVEIEDGEIGEIFNHGNASEDFDVSAIAGEIIEKETRDCLFIGNLYFTGYSYRYRYMDSIVISNDREVRSKLRKGLALSLLIFALLELVIIFVSRLITGWITKPADEAFTRQKEFIADASHELKTPLAVIMAASDEIPVREENEKYIGDIRYESDRMSRLIAGLLKLSHLEDGEDPAGFKEEDLSKIIEKTCLVYEGVAFEKGVSIETDIEEGLILKCNKEEIEQMMSTLLDNAVRHSYRDSIVRVTAGYSKAKGTVGIRVINSGDLIPKEEQEKIFERFYRSDKSRNRDENHYGLGLAIAKRIAKNHNGDIKAYSENKDTVFQVVLRS